MKFIYKIYLVALVLFFNVSFASNLDVENKIRNKSEIFKNSEIIETDIKDVFKIKFQNSKNELYYFQKEDLFIKGELLDINENKVLNITKEELKKYSKKYIDEIQSNYKNSLVHYPSTKGEVTETLYVFSDFTCPYCKKLHETLKSFQDSGIEFYYIPFPRKSMNDYMTVKGLQKIICATNKAEEYNKAFENPQKYILNVKTEDISCPEALDILIFNKYADSLGVHGTPTTFSKNGSVIKGFTNPKDYALEIRKIIDNN